MLQGITMQSIRVDVTVWAAQHLMLVDALLAGVVVLALLYRRRHAVVVWWSVTTSAMVVTSFALSRLGSLLFMDPRPFAVGHYHPLLPHTANNGFPSGYATCAAIIVVAVLFLNTRWSIPFVLLAVLIDWARVGVGFHHLIDILGAWAFVAIAGALVYVPATILAAILIPSIPTSWT